MIKSVFLLCAVTVCFAFPDTAIPTVTIAPGVDIPLAGLGTWQYNSSVAQDAVALALEMGDTHIDTALGYNNQDGIAKALAASPRARDTYFITSKIPGGFNYTTALDNLHLSLKQLGLKYVDLMLVHYPATWTGEGGKELRQQEWQAMEAFYKEGGARAIGVSHYCRRHIEDVLEVATVPIAINQVQYHVGMGSASSNATDDIAYMKSKGITYQSFSPLCGPCTPPDNMELITGELVTSIGKNHNKSGPQVALKWMTQQGIPVIPKTDKADHMRENIDLFDWELTDEEMQQLTAATKPAVAGPDGTSGDCVIN
jgi:diketogulonate reductase-like aldo/keto reductase